MTSASPMRGRKARGRLEFPEFWDEVNDLPGALLILANGGTLEEIQQAFFDGFDEAELEPVRRRTIKHLHAVINGQVDRVGRWAVKRLLKQGAVFAAHYDWDGGLKLRQEGALDTDQSLDLTATYATARLADRVARNAIVFFKCDGCGMFAVKDKRGSGNRNSKNWCSTRCRTAHAQKEKRRRDRVAKAYQETSGSG